MSFKFVEVTWKDASFSDGWEKLDDLCFPALCISRGWLVAEERDHIVLAMTIGEDDDDEVGGTWAIPKGMIVKKRVMRVRYGKS